MEQWINHMRINISYSSNEITQTISSLSIKGNDLPVNLILEEILFKTSEPLQTKPNHSSSPFGQSPFCRPSLANQDKTETSAVRLFRPIGRCRRIRVFSVLFLIPTSKKNLCLLSSFSFLSAHCTSPKSFCAAP